MDVHRDTANSERKPLDQDTVTVEAPAIYTVAATPLLCRNVFWNVLRFRGGLKLLVPNLVCALGLPYVHPLDNV